MRKRTSAKRGFSLAHKADLVELTHDSIIVFEPDGKIVFWNRGAEERYGWKREEAIGQVVWELLQTVFPTSREEIRSVLVENGRWEGELIHTRRDGAKLVLFARLVVQRDKKGVPELFMEINSDATEYKRIQALLAEAQRIAHLGSWEWDITRDKLYWSDEIYRIFGLQPQSFGANVEAFYAALHPDDRASARKAIEDALAGRKPYDFDHRVICADGSVRVVHEKGEVTFDSQGKPVRMLGTVQDVTEQRQAEAALRQSHEELEEKVRGRAGELLQEIAERRAAEERLNLALRLSEAGIWEWDLLQNTITWSETLFPAAELPTQPTDPQSWIDTIPQSYRGAVEAARDAALEQGDEIQIEFPLIRPDGSLRWLATRGRVMRSESGKPERVMGITIDITERKQTEEALKEQQQAIRALSTPVLEVTPRLLIAPIIGTVDPQRARQLTEQLLHAVRERRARAVVMDVTGVAQMDETVANHLLQTGEAVRLLGAEFIVSGISRHLAQSLVNLGVDLSRLMTVGDLRSGIEQANDLINQGDSQLAA